MPYIPVDDKPTLNLDMDSFELTTPVHCDQMNSRHKQHLNNEKALLEQVTLTSDVSGNGIATMSDAWNAPVIDLRMDGKSEQDTIAGNQLFDVSIYTGTLMRISSLVIQKTSIIITSNGASDDIYISNVTSHSVNNIPYKVSPNTNYVLSWGSIVYSVPNNVNTISSFYVGFFKNDNTPISFKNVYSYSGYLPFTTPEETDYIVIRFGWRQLTAIADETMTVSNVMLNKGDTALPWEPYTGGVASPNPNYLQDVNGVENPVVVSSIGNRNLITSSNQGTTNWTYGTNWPTKSAESYEVDGINAVKLSATFDEGVSGYYEFLQYKISNFLKTIKPNTQYNVSFDFYSDYAFTSGAVSIKWNNGKGKLTNERNFNYTELNQWKHISAVLTTNDLQENDYFQVLYISPVNKNVTRYFIIKNLKIEAGSANTPWTPAVEDITEANREELLPYINAVSLAGYTLHGIDDIRDRLECRDGVWGIYDCLEEKIFGGNETWQFASSTDAGIRFYYNAMGDTTWRLTIMSNYFMTKDVLGNTPGYIYARTNGTKVRYDIAFPHDFIEDDSAANLKVWFAARYAEGNPVRVVHEKITPIWEPLPDDLQQQLNYLKTYTGEHSTIYTVSEVVPDIEVEYFRNTPIVEALVPEMIAIKKSVSDGKKKLAAAITLQRVATAVTDSFAQMAENIKKIVLGSGNATTPDVLVGKTFTNDDGIEYTGTMPERGAVVQPLNAGESVAILEGHHNGQGKVTANSLASQTVATAIASQILAGITAWINGIKVTGTMVNRGAVSQALTINGTYTIPEGYHNGTGKITQSITTKSAATYTPGTANQVIAAGQYLSEVQTITGDADLIAANIVTGKNIFNVAGNRNYIDKISKTYNYDGYQLSSSTTTESVIALTISEAASYPYILVYWGCGGGAYFPLGGAGSTADRVYLQFSSSMYYEVYAVRPTLTTLEMHFLKVAGSGYGTCNTANIKVCAGSNVAFS